MERGALGDGGFSRELRIVFIVKQWGIASTSNALDKCVDDTKIDLSPCDAYVPKIV